MVTNLEYFLVIALISSSICEGYKILVVVPTPATSHSILGKGIVRNLLKAGHEVTYITPYPTGSNERNLHEVNISEIDEIYAFKNVTNLRTILDNKGMEADPIKYYNMLMNMNKDIMNNENVKKLISDTSKQFDVVIIEWLYSEFNSGYAAIFNCPYIWFTTHEPQSAVFSLIDEQTNPAFVPDGMSTSIPPFTFVERVKELWKQLYVNFLKTLIFIPGERKAFQTIFNPWISLRGHTIPTYDEIRLNASLILGNSHSTLGEALRLPQNYKPIAGFHIDPEVKPLPENLQKIMDQAKNGVIYFSMGSILNSKYFPDELKSEFIKMFGELNYTVLWKFEESLPNLPKNLNILKWAPQPSILSHPNCKLFITHGGLLSITESIHHGVPIIGIPGFADQFNNVERAVRKGFGKRVDLSYTMVGELKTAIDDILNTDSYMQNVKKLSFSFHHRPLSPDKELVHWVEHVVQTRGAPDLRSPALMVPWYQKMYLDLLLIVILIIVIFKFTLSRLFVSKKLVDKLKKNK